MSIARPVARFLAAPLSCVLAMIAPGCTPNPSPGTTGSASSGPTTIVDMHGIIDQSTRPANCTTATDGSTIPPLPSVWWQGVTPSVRQRSAVVGYQTWSNNARASGCPADFRTDIYRAFYTINLNQWAGRSGAIISATLTATALTVPGITQLTRDSVARNALNARLCDAQAGAAFQLVQIAGAIQLPTGFNETAINAAGLSGNPPIPNSYPAGPVIINFPGKNPLLPASLGQPRYTADITQLVVGALQANVNMLKFMITGTNEPPTRQDHPRVPQTECRAIFSVNVDVRAA